LRAASYFRLFPVTLPQREVRSTGKLSDSDWESVRVCFRAGFGGEQFRATYKLTEGAE
jgi:hypothetical protein